MERWHTKYVEKQVHDTTYIAKVDTIREVFTNEVEKPLTWWQQTKMHIRGPLRSMLALIVGHIWVDRRSDARESSINETLNSFRAK